MLILGATWWTGSTKAKRAASGIRQLETPYQSTMGYQRESDPNLLNLKQISSIDIESVAQMYPTKKLFLKAKEQTFIKY